MATPSEGHVHPGAFVREHVIPAGMSVKEAAERLRIGRPALSNFLNANSSLSSEMAVRLEKAFGADRQRLLEMQAAYDRHELVAGEKRVEVRAFVPSFLTIKARQVEGWAESQIDARSHLPVLLRKLVHSTSNDLRRVDFPGYDNAQRKGSDGFVEAGAATPWIPLGASYWEFGTDKDPRGKANRDYEKRLETVSPAERASGTFVFVTPRKWHGKTDWVKEKATAGDWSEIRAFDASDLEQWLEQSVPAQIWLAEQIGQPVTGYETLDQAWHRWARASEPHLAREIFEPSIAAYSGEFEKWLNQPSDRPFVVAADSRDEALAFLFCLFEGETLRRCKDLAAVFTSPETLGKLVASSVPFIPIVHSLDAERALLDVHRRLHCIVFRPRNAVDTEPDIALDLLTYDAFERAVTAMGIDEGEVDRLARESGRSPTILRRRLSRNSAIRSPAWASDDGTAKTLVPMALIGAWHEESEADREIVKYVADRDYSLIEDDIARLLPYDDSPVWSSGRYRGAVSKIDALFAVARLITSTDLERFIEAAEYVLSESDPALELPEESRWAAAIYDKVRDHSGALRSGICETLVILAVHGNSLFQSRLGTNVGDKVSALVRRLLTPLSLEKLLSHEYELPAYAEAAPDEFLKIIEQDLRSDDPVVLGLLKPVDSGLFGARPSRTGLLWALEGLAWTSQNLPRVAAILARLSQRKIDDNWMNKPTESLQAIFRFWMPQTAASVQERLGVMERLTEQFPGVGWKLCIDQLRPGSRIGSSSHRPRWRSDASGAGQVVRSSEERIVAKRGALELLIAWPVHDEKTLGDLVGCLQGMSDDDQVKVWDLIDDWCQEASDFAKAELRECVRRFAFTRRGPRGELMEATRIRAHEILDRLRPHDLVVRHRWLFADHWVPVSAEEIEQEDFDYQERDKQINRLRRDAINEIWIERGFEGVRELLVGSGTAETIGRYLALCLSSVSSREGFIRRLLSLDGELRSSAEWCLRGFLFALEDDAWTCSMQSLAERLADEECTRFLVCAPFKALTWRLVESRGGEIHTEYWKRVMPSWAGQTPAELTELIDRLLEVKRPRAAFYAAHMDFKDIETSRLRRLLRDAGTVNAEPSGQFKLDSYHISVALDSLGGRPGVSRDEMAQLEFFFLDALDHSRHGIPNLERQMAESPGVFVQAVALVYKRSDGGEDPPEWRIENEAQRSAVASAAYRLLERIKKTPGTDENGKIDKAALGDWIFAVRRMCHDCARSEVGDLCVGQLLAKSPLDETGIWPCRAVCEAMESIATEELGRGFRIGVHNSRGVRFGNDGGEQERELAAKYRAWAQSVNVDFPYVGSVLEGVAASYEREAGWWDTEASVEKRLSD